MNTEAAIKERLRLITLGHDEYNRILAGENTVVKAENCAPLALGGATMTLLRDVDELASRVTAYRNYYSRTNYTPEETRRTIINGSCSEAPPDPPSNDWDAFNLALANNDRPEAARLATDLENRRSPSYLHRVTCNRYPCATLTDRTSALLYTTKSSKGTQPSQPGCQNPDWDTPGHPRQGQTVCWDKSHMPSAQICELTSLQEYTKYTHDLGYHILTPEEAATMLTSAQDMRERLAAHHPTSTQGYQDDRSRYQIWPGPSNDSFGGQYSYHDDPNGWQFEYNTGDP